MPGLHNVYVLGEQVDHQWRCNFFKRSSDVRKEMIKKAILEPFMECIFNGAWICFLFCMCMSSRSASFLVMLTWSRVFQFGGFNEFGINPTSKFHFLSSCSSLSQTLSCGDHFRVNDVKMRQLLIFLKLTLWIIEIICRSELFDRGLASFSCLRL